MKYTGEESKIQKSSSIKSVGRIAAIVLLVAAGVLLFQYRSNLSTRISKVLAASEEDPVPVTKLTRQPFSLTVPSTGEIVGLETTPVPTPSTSSGSLTIAWLIREGSFVKAGDPVIRFDSTDAKLNLEKQQNTLGSNQENTKITTQQQITDDRTLAIDKASAEEDYKYDMTVMPQDETIYSKWDIITAQADARYDKERIEFLKSKVKTQTRIARSDQQILAIERNKAQTQVSLLKQTMNSLELRTPVGGLVLYRRDRRQEPQVGDRSYPGQVVVEIINLDVLQARLYVLERDGGNLEKGQPAVIKLDAIPEKQYHGTIRSVSTVAAALEVNSVLRYFTCDVYITDAGRDLKRIRPGMNLEGDVILQNYESCFVVPSGAVTYREKERSSLVYVKKGDKFVAKTVKTGLSSHGEATILDGVEDGELIALTNPFETRKLYLPDFSKGSTTQQGRGPMGGMPPGGGGMMMRGGPGF
ncbi:MAG TPA: HlyD family efflux transporter periplasmic adaptor subunit [Acidobacteriota bacterium]|nr:HlyD family efflux transporter periplasmic adaptor subunit [Acidobacteriota bacterium]